jgi:hypothetical protein
MSDQDVNRVVVEALQRRTAIARELSAVRLSLQAGVSEMKRGAYTAKRFLDRGSIVSIASVAGEVNSSQLAQWMGRMNELEKERHEIDKGLRGMGIDWPRGE